MLRRVSVRLPILAILVAQVTIPQEAAAQHRIFDLDGAAAGDRLGASVASVGDVNNDGYPDVIIGSPYDDTTKGVDSGSARVLSGRDGSVLFTFEGDSANAGFGGAVAGAGDVDGDGVPDIIIGAGLDDTTGTDAGSVWVVSGLSGLPIYTLYGTGSGDYFGCAVDGAGDFNSDGFADFVIGAMGFDNRGNLDSGMAEVYSGLDGDVLFTFNGFAAGDEFGCAVAGIGDFNGNHFPDVAIGAKGSDFFGLDAGSIDVFTSKGGFRESRFYGDTLHAGFGISIDGLGDINGDRQTDIIVGAAGDATWVAGGGSARVISGKGGMVLDTFYGKAANDEFGTAVAGGGDVDQDGFIDYIVGVPGDDANGVDAGSVRVISGFDQSTIHEFRGATAGGLFGSAVGNPGDVNGDGHGDVVAGAWSSDTAGADAGGVRVLSGKALTLWSDTHELSWVGAGTQNLSIDAGAAHAGRQYWMFGSVTGTQPGTPFGGVSIPLNLDTWTLIELSFLNTPTFSSFQGQLDSSGQAAASINLPAGLPAALGFTMYHAYVVHNANLVPFMASNAVTLHLRD